MQVTIANNNFEFRDVILKKQAHEISKIYNKRGMSELDDMEMMDEVLRIFIVSINGDTDISKFQNVFDNMTLEDYNQLVSEGGKLFDGLKKNENSSTSTKPSSIEAVEVSVKNG